MAEFAHPLDRPAGLYHGAFLATVVSVKDPDSRSRVQVKLVAADGKQEAPIWARVAVPFAGNNMGAFFLPNVDDEVLVTFVNGDVRLPMVIGGLWNGNAPAKETLGGSGDRVDRWTLVGKNGTRIAITEEQEGAEIKFTTPNGATGVLSDKSGGKIELSDSSGNSVKLDTSGVTINTSSDVTVQASQVKVTAGMVQVSAGMSQFSGVVQCDTLMATTVVASTYTPGAGNVW